MHLAVSIQIEMINCFNVRIASNSDARRKLHKRSLLFTLVMFIIVTCPQQGYVVDCSISVLLLSTTNQSNRVDHQPIRAGVTNLFRQARSSLS